MGSINLGSNGTITNLAVGGLPDGTVDGDTLAANAVTSAKITDGTIAVGDLATGINTPACQVYMSANMTSLGNDTLTKLEFDTEDFDTDSAYDTTNKKFTVPANKGGKYLINACAYVAAGVDMYTQIHIYKNGSSVAYNYNHGSASAGGSLSNNITRVITLAATDYIEFYVSTNATTRTVYTSNNIGRTTASIVRLIT